MLTLRPYQKEPVRKAIEYFQEENDEPALMVFPTGWGKSVAAAEVAAACPDPILVVQPTKELLEQNLNKYRLLCGELAPAGVYSASFGKKDIDHVTFATIGSIKTIGEQFRRLGFRKMFIDEAHLYPRKEQSMLGQFLRDSGIRQVLGMTATPLKLESFSEKQGERFDKWSELIMLTNPSPSGTFFKRILHVSQISEMTGMGFWSPLRYELIPFDKSELHLNSSGSEYSDEAVARAYALNNVRANIFAALNYHSERRHILVFVPSVEEAAILADEYPESSYVCGETPKKQRAAILEAFRSEELRVIFNVGVLSTGFDYTKIDMIVLGFSTSSVAKYYQIVGRGVRIDPGKKDCIIVDMGGNVERFGAVEDIRFEYDGKWRMYGSDGVLLSGVPIRNLGDITDADVALSQSWGFTDRVITFGKYKGKTLREVPLSYLGWMLSSTRFDDPVFRAQVCAIMEDHVRDTTGDPPMQVIPDGKYAGTPIADVPRNYLMNYYVGSRDWNETTDSLRRGLLAVLGPLPELETRL